MTRTVAARPPAPSPAAGEGRGAARRRSFPARTGLTILAFLAPAIVVVAVFTYGPVLSGIQMAFRRWTMYDLTSTPWVGLGNFRAVIASTDFAVIARNTVIWVVCSLIPQFAIGFAIALALRRRFRFRGLYQALVFFPWAVSGFLIGILFRWLFNAEFGVVNDLILKSGLTDQRIPWLANPRLGLVAIIIANVWYGVTFFAIMILAALQSVPEETIEAAAVDGAGRWRTLFSIVVPAIRPTLVLTVLLRVIWIFNFPDLIFGMTAGGPANQTHIITTWMIAKTQQGEYGIASALGLIAILILSVFTLFYLTALRRSDR
jgi:multiple sugar transport system permease protein